MVTCCERADILALVGDVYCIFVTFPCGNLVQVWYLIISFPDLCVFLTLIIMLLLGEMSKILCIDPDRGTGGLEPTPEKWHSYRVFNERDRRMNRSITDNKP